MRAAVLMMLFYAGRCPRGAQDSDTDRPIPPPPVKTVNLSGPRFGFTALSDGVVREAARAGDRRAVRASRSSAGSSRNSSTARQAASRRCNEFVVLVGGLEQGVVAAEPELAGRTAIAERRRVRLGSQHHPGRRGARARGRCDVPLGSAERADNIRGRALEGRHASQHADRIQHARTTVTRPLRFEHLTERQFETSAGATSSRRRPLPEIVHPGRERDTRRCGPRTLDHRTDHAPRTKDQGPWRHSRNSRNRVTASASACVRSPRQKRRRLSP